MDQQDWNRSNEKLSVISIQTTSDNYLNITVKNTGNVQSEITWLGLFNQSVTPEAQWFFSVSQPISIGETQSFLSPFMVAADQKHAVQLVTKEGNVFDYTLYPANQAALALSLIAVSPTVYQANNVTLFLTVTNNNTEGMAVENITVSLLTVPSTLTSVLSVPSSLTISSLAAGASAFFTWTYATLDTGTVLFEATYNQAPQGTLATAIVTILAAPTGSNSQSQGQVTITGTSATAPFHPAQWNTLGGTSYVSGTIQSLSTSDENTAAFASYYTGTTSTLNQYVTSSSSNIDNSANVGVLTNFAGMQSGPDGNYAILTEETTSNPDGSFGNTATSSASYTSNNGNRMLGGAFTSGNLATSVNSISFFGRSNSGTISAKAVICDNSGNILANGISDPSSVTTSATWRTLTFSSPPTIEPNTTYWLMLITSGNVRFYYSSATGGDAKYDSNNNYASPTDPTDATSASQQYRIYATTSSIDTYSLDFETQWTGVDTGMQTNNLALYLAGQSGSEDVAVDAWIDGEWQNLFSGLSTGWNNISITPYIDSSTFTIRFRENSPLDLTQNSWNIDAVLIQQTGNNDQYTGVVEFTGSSNTNTWTSLIWNVESHFDANNVNVTIQFYNYTLGSYVSTGSGFTSFVSIADTSNLQSFTLISNSGDFKNGSGAWKLKITAVKDTSTQFNMYFDWIEIDPTYISNGGSLSYGALQNYIITSTSTNGGPTPYVYVSIYANGSSITLQNGATNQTIANPAWVQLDANGIYSIRLQSITGSSETFALFVSVGTTVGQKIIVQEAQ